MNAAVVSPAPLSISGRGVFLPGDRYAPERAGEAARDAALRADHPARNLAAWIAAELAQNAVRHSRSGDRRGELVVHVAADPYMLRIEVTDLGPRLERPSAPVAAPIPRTPGVAVRGLTLVSMYTRDWGYTDHPIGSRSVWAVIEA
ncbi:ATP-binding protein [Nocardiopsis mangrovi]|uniref:ATP-binding protein n=1 Tax=Nocardiopsis mangrovi TaxID=1179818 RepID=A0ABV9DV06_9ACTN